MDDATARTEAEPTVPPVTPVHLSVPAVCAVGSVVWLVVLVVTVAVPTLHTGDRSWWPWTAVVGTALGVACWLSVRPGRGNASGA